MAITTPIAPSIMIIIGHIGTGGMANAIITHTAAISAIMVMVTTAATPTADRR